MKAFAKIGISACLLMAAGLMYGCGDDDYTQTGQVVKAPVFGAKVKFEGFNNYSTRSGQNGRFVIAHPNAKMTSTGGTFFDLATGTTKNAPTMLAPAGAANITALTTLVANASPADATALQQMFAKLGISYDNALATVSSDGKNKSAMALNEIIGDLLVRNVSTANITAFMNNLVPLVVALPTATDFSNPDIILEKVNTAATTTSNETSGAFNAAAVSAAATTIVAEIKSLPVNQPLPTPTGTTGGTGGSGTGGNF